MATPAQREELKTKIGDFVSYHFHGDYAKAFAKYANSRGNVGHADLLSLLGDADVGSWLTRGAWAKGIIAELDKDSDGEISLAEFEGVLKP